MIESSNKPKKYLRLTNDYAFKHTIGNPDYPILMLTLLQALIPERNIKTIEFLDTEPRVSDETVKRPRYDIKCQEPDGTTFIVEMQVAIYKNYFDRLMIYSSDSLGRLLKKGEAYSEMRPLYVISILDYAIKLMRDSEENQGKLLRRAHMHMDDNADDILTNVVNFLFLQLPNVGEISANGSTIEKIAYSIRHMHEFDDKPKGLQGKFFDILFQLSNRDAMSEEEIQLYDRLEFDERQIEAEKVAAYSEGVEFGKKEGVEIGKKEGVEIGKKEGVKIGKKEGFELGKQQAFREHVLNLNKHGMTASQISEILEIPLDVVESYLS